MQRSNAHVIVLGNEKGGSGKSTTAAHLAVHLLHEGYRVATIDADSRQHTLTTYIRNRREWARAHDVKVPHPTHFHLPRAHGNSLDDNARLEFELFRQAVAEAEGDADYLVIDTPGFDTHLTRIAHSLADTLITPLNDSLVDMEVIAKVDPASGHVLELNHYARLVQRARRERLGIDGRTIDWVLMRNRISMLKSRNARVVQTALDNIAERLGCRIADGIAERVIFRSLFPIGMTVFDPLESDALRSLTTTSHIGARREYEQLVHALNLTGRAVGRARGPFAGKVLGVVKPI